MSPANSNPDQGTRQLVTQATDITTATTLHAREGQITTQAAAAIANAEDSFVLTNRFITPASVVALGFTYAGSGACSYRSSRTCRCAFRVPLRSHWETTGNPSRLTRAQPCLTRR